MQTTKLIKVDEPQPDEHILSVKSLNLTNSDVTETNQSDPNDTVEIVMTDDANATEVSEISERKSKGLLGYSEEAKVVNNISSRSTLQSVSQSQSTSNDRLSSEALFEPNEESGGFSIGAGIIAVICVGIVGSLAAFSVMFVYVYRRRYLNKPQTLSEPDSSGYIDESSIRVRKLLENLSLTRNSLSSFLLGQFGRALQSRQRLLPELSRGNDDTELLDGQRQTHQAVETIATSTI